MERKNNRAANGITRSFAKNIISGVLILFGIAKADQVSFSTKNDWNRWDHPNGSIQFSSTGSIKPTAVRKNIDAIKNAQIKIDEKANKEFHQLKATSGGEFDVIASLPGAPKKPQPPPQTL